ncbi:nuclear transport factor 2 family protein [Kordiimonas marina]|uniref:nuclear transport factor 2 family protein n=1 Tax=Kordiimonas marina TaxID=2872312 RepID=UPI001FF55D42|nr:nuclear transport factor 2 family protein [Kordiimonas marina]MCJ9430630.1 nuclear transport factor 2 family protein [Kordiimonas marina]
MRKRPIALAVMMALILPGSTAYAGGKHSIGRLRTLEAAKNRAMSFEQQQARQDEAYLQKRNVAPKAKKAAPKKEEHKIPYIPGFGPKKDRLEVAYADTTYQAAVKSNDFRTLYNILAPAVSVVLGNGKTVTRREILAEAQSNTVHYKQQDEVPGTRSVRVFGDMAVVTALLWVKGEGLQGQFDDHLWFSSTYLRTPKGWLYCFGQVSLPLAPDAVDEAVKQAKLAMQVNLAAEKSSDPSGPYAQASPYDQTGGDIQTFKYGRSGRLSRSSRSSQYGQDSQYGQADQSGTNQYGTDQSSGTDPYGNDPYGTGSQTDQGYQTDQTGQDGQDNQDNQNTDPSSPYH